MSILIKMDKDKITHIDYIFICDVYTKDPRYKTRNIKIGENIGLFRIHKKTMDVELLLMMEGDTNKRCFHKAATKILREYSSTNKYPENAYTAYG